MFSKTSSFIFVRYSVGKLKNQFKNKGILIQENDIKNKKKKVGVCHYDCQTQSFYEMLHKV